MKDILVRENDNRIRETEELRAAMELSTQELVDGIEKAKADSKKQVKALEKDLEETMIKDKKNMLEKLENTGNDLKKKIEMETNEIRYFFYHQKLCNSFVLQYFSCVGTKCKRSARQWPQKWTRKTTSEEKN